MGDLGNFGDLNDYVNAKDSWLSSLGKANRAVIFYQFAEYKTFNSANPNEATRKPMFSKRSDNIWLSFYKAFDTTKGGYFTTGDIDVISEFPLRGFSAGIDLTTGKSIDNYAGDMIEWNGKLWEVADVQEPIQWGYQNPQVWYHTIMRRSNLTGIGIVTGP